MSKQKGRKRRTKWTPGTPRGPYGLKDGLKLCMGPLHKGEDYKGTWLELEDFYRLRRDRSTGRYQYYSSWCKACSKDLARRTGRQGYRANGGWVKVETLRPLAQRILNAHGGSIPDAAAYIGFHGTSLQAILGHYANAQKNVTRKTAAKVVAAALKLKLEQEEQQVA